MQDYEEFKKYFNRNFWKAFSQSFLIFSEIINDQKEEILDCLYKQIQNRKYYPSTPKTYLYRDKGGCITRSIPVFEIKDYCLYYYCIKRLEKKIALNRTENTFGGWTLGGAVRKSEDEEIENRTQQHQSFEEMIADIYGVSISEYSFNPKAWSKVYGDFNSKLYATSQESNYKYVVEFDISNFYDCIRLDLLEIWIREISEKENSEEVSLLFHFLNYWNRKINAYNKQTVGIPQDAMGDCSRILANFYLQEYDKYIFDLCRKNNCRYFRYSDDQFIFGETKEKLEYLIFLASKNLSCYGLNINQKKISYRTTDELIIHRSFEIFDKVREEKSKNKECVEEFLDCFFQIKEESSTEDLQNRGLPLLNKAIFCNIKEISIEKKYKIIGYLLEDKFLRQAKFDQLKRLYELIEDKDQKKEMVDKLQKLSASTFHNAFHYEVLKFFKSIKQEASFVLTRIKELEI